MVKIPAGMVLLAKIVLFLAGGLSILWSLVCFLGGPDGKIGSKESIVWGLGFLVVGCVVVRAGKLVGKPKPEK